MYHEMFFLVTKSPIIKWVSTSTSTVDPHFMVVLDKCVPTHFFGCICLANDTIFFGQLCKLQMIQSLCFGQLCRTMQS